MIQLKTIILIAFGGGLGSVFRFSISLFIASKTSGQFPLSTFIINCLGSLLIGVIVGLSTKNNWFESSNYWFLTTGFCGGFTTFSAFSLENFKLLQNGNILTVIAYSSLSVFLGILLVYIGWRFAK